MRLKDADLLAKTIEKAQMESRRVSVLSLVHDAPNVKAFTRAELEAWLYEIALNNCGNSLERACVELISRLDGFERFVESKRKEANNESQEM